MCVMGSHGDQASLSKCARARGLRHGARGEHARPTPVARRMFLGSTADWVAHHVHCDLMLVKRAPKQQQ